MLNNKDFIVMDIEQFPIITMKLFPETLDDANNWIAEMDLVLAEKQKIALVYPPIIKKNEKEDMEGMKAVRRWLKEGKALLAEYCTGMIMTVNTQTNDKEQLVQMCPLISTVYGTPVLVEDTLDESYNKANALLKN